MANFRRRGHLFLAQVLSEMGSKDAGRAVWEETGDLESKGLWAGADSAGHRTKRLECRPPAANLRWDRCSPGLPGAGARAHEAGALTWKPPRPGEQTPASYTVPIPTAMQKTHSFLAAQLGPRTTQGNTRAFCTSLSWGAPAPACIARRRPAQPRPHTKALEPRSLPSRTAGSGHLESPPKPRIRSP